MRSLWIQAIASSATESHVSLCPNYSVQPGGTQIAGDDLIGMVSLGQQRSVM